jgi:aminoglycoside 3-N-acetyltransferase I
MAQRKHGDYVYRHLSSADLETLKQLLEVFGTAFEDREAYQTAVPGDEYLRLLLAKPHFMVLVALSEDRVVGGLAAYVLDKFEQERKEIYIYDLAVLEGHRRRGIATRLITELKGIARQIGVYVIYVQADKVDDAAVKLYQSLGTKEDVFHFDILPDA